MYNHLLSQRGKKKFSCDGFSYVFDKTSSDGNTKFWRCEDKDHCKTRIHTVDDQVVKTINEHTHGSSAAKVEVGLAMSRIKRRAQDTVEGTIQVVNECTVGLSRAAQAALPSYDALRKTIRRKRNEMNCAPPSPLSLQDLIIPETYTFYEPQPGLREMFLLADSGPGDNRIIIFGRNQSLEILKNSRQWYGDGTFKPAPPLFAQIYTILAEAHGGVHPIFYALLPNKQRRTYKQMFELIQTIKPGLNPESISCDFEAAAFNAMTDCFEGVRIYGCFFHLVHNMQKHISSNGLMPRYKNDADFALKAKMIATLSFVPMPDVDEAIDLLAQELPQELQPILEWFEDNYVGRVNRRGNGRRPAMFPPEMWNLYDRVINGQNRTNNVAEAAHRRIQIELGMDHPTIWKLIDGLRKVQKGRDIYYEKLVAGHRPQLKLKKYRKADERIFAIVNDYQNRNLLEYLRGIAHNYEMH